MPPRPSVRARSDRRRRAGGFTLLEVLVAFIIAALALGVMFDGVLGGMRAAAAAAHTEAALSLARSRLAETLAALQSGAVTAVSDQQGDDGHGFHWAVRVRPGASVELPSAGPGSGLGGDRGQPVPRVTLYSVAVAVGWGMDGGHRQVQLDGEKLVMRGVAAS